VDYVDRFRFIPTICSLANCIPVWIWHGQHIPYLGLLSGFSHCICESDESVSSSPKNVSASGSSDAANGRPRRFLMAEVAAGRGGYRRIGCVASWGASQSLRPVRNLSTGGTQVITESWRTMDQGAFCSALDNDSCCPGFNSGISSNHGGMPVLRWAATGDGILLSAVLWEGDRGSETKRTSCSAKTHN
jgi:hypothetical protein